jgi:hypothetical protein
VTTQNIRRNQVPHPAASTLSPDGEIKNLRFQVLEFLDCRQECNKHSYRNEGRQRSPTDGTDYEALDFPNTAYSHILLQPLWSYVNNLKALPACVVITWLSLPKIVRTDRLDNRREMQWRALQSGNVTGRHVRIVGRPNKLRVLITFHKDLVEGARGGIVVKALSYKPAGRGFDFRWCHWNFLVT